MFLIDGRSVIMEESPSPFLPSVFLVHKTSFPTSPRPWRSSTRVPPTGSILGKGRGCTDHGGGEGAPLAHIALQSDFLGCRVTDPGFQGSLLLHTLSCPPWATSLVLMAARLSSPQALILGVMMGYWEWLVCGRDCWRLKSSSCSK